MFGIVDRVKLDKIAYQLIYSYAYIKQEFEDFELRRGIVNWRYEIFDCLIELDKDQINYILRILKQEDERVYLEIFNIYDEYSHQKEKKHKVNLKWKEADEKVCSNSGIHIW